MNKKISGVVNTVLISFILLSSLNVYAQTWNADLVIGHSNFTSAGFNNLDNNDLYYPYSNAVIVAGKYIVADSSNHRVLIYNTIPTTNGAQANVVIGQPNFNTNTSGVSATKLNNPVGVHSDGTRLFIADYNNHRVLIYNSIPTTNGAAANVVIGQTSFTARTAGTSQTKLYYPTGVFSDGTKLYIADYYNHRVLIYNSIPTTNGAAASVVVGQTDFITRTSGLSQTKFNYPWGVHANGTKLFVADRNNNRVLIYNSIPTANGAAASVVVGQPDFITGTSGVSQTKMYYPTGVYANGTKLYVADSYNHRALIYNTIPTANGALASVVVGQTSFTVRTSGTSSTKLYYPAGICVNGTKMFIADRSNHRALIYNSIPTTNGAAASVVVGHSTFTNGTANDVDGAGIWYTGRSCIAAGKLFVADPTNNRVLIYNTVPTSNGVSADLVIGQTSLESNTAGTSQTKLRYPAAVYCDGTKVYIADRNNNRVLIYNSIPTTNGAAASVVVGQSSFTTSTAATSQTGLRIPRDVFVDTNGKLYIGDSLNHRIIIHNTIPTTNGRAADVVVGQPDFITGTSGLTQSKMNTPYGVQSNGTKLFVADTLNNRVLIYNTIPTTNGALADVVIGQTNFTTGTSGTSQTKLYNPNRIFVPNGKNKIYIADSNNHRIIIYDSIPTTNGAAANKVVGQDTFTTRTTGTSTSKFNYPNFAFIDSTKLWVSDYYNHRVVAGPIPNNPPVLDPIGNKTGNEGALLQFTISATDTDNDTLTYSASNLPSGATFDPATKTFSWTPTYGQAGTYPNVHFEVSDGLTTDFEDISITINSTVKYIKLQNGYFFDTAKNDYWLPHGIAYQTWNRPLGMWQTTDQIDYDLDEMVKAHVNSIRVDFVWKHIEETGDNIFSWTNYDYLVNACAQRGIRIFALVGYQWPPDWFPKTTADDPDAGWYTMHPPGYDTEGVYQPNRWRSDIMSFEDANARAQYKEFLAAVAARYKNNPTIVAWIVGNEYGYLGLWSGKQDGYDKDSEAAFRNWLSTYYSGNIANLNSVWGTSYTSFSQVVMPTPYNRDNPAWWDLVQWREDSVAKFTAEGAKAVRDADLNHLISYATVGMQWGEEDWRYHAEDTGKIAKACKDLGAPLSFWSINNYPWGLLGHESQTGQWGITNAKWRTGLPVLYTETGFTSSETMYPGLNENNQGRLIRNSLWEALETGAIGVHIFTWNDRTYITDREKGFGLLYADRRIKPAFWVVRDTYNLMDQVDATHLFANSTDPTPDVAFYWSDATDAMYNRYECNMQQLYGPLERLGLEPTFINRDQLLAGEYTKYKAIILPRNMRMYAGDLNFIRTNVIPAGVHVYADADLPGMQDYHVKPLSDFATEMDNIFGVNVSNTSGYDDPVENEKYGINWTKIDVTVTQNLSPLYQWRNDTFYVWKYSNMITATTGTVYATHSNGNAALVIKNNGTAKAAITTFSLGDRNPDSNADGEPDITPWAQRHDWLNAIFLNSFGINPAIKVYGSRYVLVDYRTCADGSILISAKNYSNNTIQTVNIETDLIAGKTIKSLTSGGILQEKSGGMVSVALEADGHELLQAFGSGIPPVPGTETSENNMWKQGVGRASNFASGPSTFPLTLKWNQSVGSSIGSPVATDTTLYISSYNEVRALNPATGAVVWKFAIDETNANFEGLMAVANGMLFVGTRNLAGGQYPRGTLYCLDTVSGKLNWKRAAMNWIASAPVVSDGVVYYGGSDAYVYAVVAKTGRLKWSYYGGSSLAGLAVYNGAVYFGTTSDMWSAGPGGVVYALNISDGSLKWKNTIANYIDSTPAVVNGKVYISVDKWYDATDGLYCFDAANGTLLWNSTIGGSYSHSSPAVAGGIAYIGGSDNRLYAFDANTGALKWSYLTGGSLYNCAPVVANGVVYITSDKFYALNATTGALVWSYTQSGWRSPYPKSGWIFFTNYSSLYAFSDGTAWTGTPPTPPTPTSQNASVYILDAPATVHPMGDKSYQVKIRYDTRATNLNLNIAFQEDGDNGDGISNEIYQLYTYAVTGDTDISYWFWIPEPNLGDTDYKSTIDGGKYVFHAWLEESSVKIAEAYHSTILEWGANPTTPVPTSLQKGQTYTLNLEWEELPEYLWWENSPLDRETTYPQRIAVARSSKTQAQYPTHYDKVNQTCDWLESLGYSHSNPAHTHFDDTSVTNGATTLFSDNFNDGNADGWTQSSGSSRWKVDSLEFSVDRIGQGSNIQVAGTSTWTNYTYEAKVKYVTFDPYFKEAGLVFRYQDPDNFYVYKIYDFYGTWRLIFAGEVGGIQFSQRIVDISPLNANTFYTLKVVANGSDFTFYLNGTQQGSAITDARLANGKIGLFARASQLGVWEPTKGYYFVDDTETSEDRLPSGKLIWSVSYDPTDGNVRALAVYNNKLYAGTGYNGNIYVYDGTTWSLSYDAAESQVYGLGVYNNKLYAAVDSKIYVYDGVSWQLAYTHPSSGYFFSLETYSNKLYVGADNGQIYVYNGTGWSLAYQYPSDGSMVQCMKVYNNKLYTGSSSQIYVYDGTSWSISGTFSPDVTQFRSMGLYNNKLYASGDGSNPKAKIFAFDGTAWSTAYTTIHDSVRSFENLNNKFYYGTGDYSGSPPSKGEIYFYDGTNWDWDYDTKDMMVYSLAVYNNKLYAGTDWNVRILEGKVDTGTPGELLNFNWGYLKEFFQAIVLPSVYVMNNEECYNLKFYLQEGLFTAIATDGGVAIKKSDGSSGVGRIESIFGVGTSYTALSSLQNLEITDNTHYITHEYNNGQLIATNPSAQATAWTVTTTGRKVADIKNATSSAPALISNTVTKGDIYFQDFELDNTTKGAYYYDVSQSAPSFSTTTVHSGTRALKIVTGTTYGTVGINAATPAGYFDLTKMTKLYAWVYDTQGNNYPMLKLKDVWGNVSGAYVNSYQPAVKNQWTLVRWDKYSGWTDVDLSRIASIQIVEYNQGTYYFDDIYYETTDFGEKKSKVFTFNYGVDTYTQLTNQFNLISQRTFEWGTREIYKMKIQLKYPTDNPADGDLVIAEKEVWIIDGSGTVTVQIPVPSVTMTGDNLYWVAYVYPWDSTDPWRDHMGFYTSANDPGYNVALSGYGLMITGVTDYGHGGRAFDLWAAYNTRGDTLKLNYGLKEKGDNGDGKSDEVYYSPFYDGKTDPNYWLYEYTNTWEFRGSDTGERPTLYLVFKDISSATTPQLTFELFNLSSTSLTLQKSADRQNWTTIYTSPTTQGPYNPTVNLDKTAMYYRFGTSGTGSDLIILRKNMTLTGYPTATKFRMEDWRQTAIVNGVDDDITYWPWVPDYDTGFSDYIGTLSGGNYEWKAWYTETSDAYYKPMKVYWGPRFKVEDVNFPTKIVPGTTVNVPIKWENLTTYPAKLRLMLQRVYPGRYASTGGVAAQQDYDLSTASGENTFAITVPTGTASSINYMWVAYVYPPGAGNPYNQRMGLDDTWRYNPNGQPYEEEQRTYVGQKFTLSAPTSLQKNVRANFTLNFSWQNLPAGYIYTVWYNLTEDDTDYGYNAAYDNGAGHEFWGETFTIDNTTGANSTGTRSVVKDITIYNYNRFIWKTTLDSSQYSGYEGEDAVKATGY